MSDRAVLHIGAEAIEEFVKASRSRTILPDENETFLAFVEQYIAAVNAHLAEGTAFDFGRFKVRAEVLRARFSAPESEPGDCGTEGGCEGCQNHFCQRRWPD